ncbi:MAG: ECF transporter S component [Clostridium sp.]|uniref:ECF transporter S component n=1 Tax=Clostridium sp. TaxID=1506 RepID=UPI003EE5AD35
MREKTKLLTYASLLIALSIIIPIQFGFLKIYIPPFSATLAAHVPMFISMVISPIVAVVVGVGSTIGFLLAGMSMPVVFRASTHIIVGYIGAKLIEKNMGYIKITLFIGMLHGVLEALVVMPFVGLDLFNLLVVTGVGGFLHHLVDGGISYWILKVMSISKLKINFKENMNNEEKY